jgi:hypothetical protein
MKSIIKILISLMTLLLVMTGCEYDVAQPQWEKDHEAPPVPVINGIEPEGGAVAGVNKITISGEYFSEIPENNHIYFDNVEAEVIECDTASITVRRPNIVNDSSVITLASYDALLVAKYSPYRVDAVMGRYGNFLENDPLSAIEVDENENMYVVFTTAPRNIYKVTPDGERTLVATSASSVYDAKMAPDGNLILFANAKEIYKLDIVNGADTTVVWAEVPKRVKFGDFDAHGNLYTGTKSSDLIVLRPDLTTSSLGMYAKDEIFCVRVYDGHVYLLVELSKGEPELAIWRHAILDVNGTLGAAELVLDWADTGEYAESTPAGFTFDKDGNMYIGTDFIHPVMKVTDGVADIYYKGILPGPAKQIVWGTGNAMYMLLNAASEVTVIRIDMGIEGAPYYGR